MGLQTEIGDIIAEAVCDASVMEGNGSEHYAKQIIAKMSEVVEEIDNEYADIREYKISHRVWEEARQAILKAMED